MRILEINKYHYIKGGADSVFFNTCALLRGHGNEVAEMCVRHPDNLPSLWEPYFVDAPELRNQGVMGKIRGIPRFFINRHAARQIERLIKDFRPEIAHIHNIFNGISLSILPVLRHYGVPVAVTMHDTRFICPSSFFMRPGRRCTHCLERGGIYCGLDRCYQDSRLNSWMCAAEMMHKERLMPYDRYIDRYVFVSRRYKELHGERHEWFRRKGEVLYNFMPSLDRFVPEPRKGDYLLFYGRVTVEKGIGTLMEAMRHMPQARLKVAGTGPLLDELKAMKLQNVEFLGFMSGDALFDVVRGASAVVVPSEWEENNPLTVIEAYAIGKPVVGARIGGIPELISPSTGWLFEPGNVEDLSDAIGNALAVSDGEYARMSASARRFAESAFCPDEHYDRLMGIFNDIIRTK